MPDGALGAGVAATLAISARGRADVARAPDPPGPTFAVRVNPLALLIGKRSADAEAWLGPVSVGVGVFRVRAEDGVAADPYLGNPTRTDQKLSLTGVEIGAKHYFFWKYRAANAGSRWSNRFGPFVGASVGMGLQYTKRNVDPFGQCASEWFCVSTINPYYRDGLRPRFLLSVGLAL